MWDSRFLLQIPAQFWLVLRNNPPITKLSPEEVFHIKKMSLLFNCQISFSCFSVSCLLLSQHPRWPLGLKDKLFTGLREHLEGLHVTFSPNVS